MGLKSDHILYQTIAKNNKKADQNQKLRSRKNSLLLILLKKPFVSSRYLEHAFYLSNFGACFDYHPLTAFDDRVPRPLIRPYCTEVAYFVEEKIQRGCGVAQKIRDYVHLFEDLEHSN